MRSSELWDLFSNAQRCQRVQSSMYPALYAFRINVHQSTSNVQSCLMDELSRGDSYFVASPLNQGERTKVRGSSTSVRCFQITLTLSQTHSFALTGPAAAGSVSPKRERRGRVDTYACRTFGFGGVPQRMTESDFLIPTSERLYPPDA